MCGLTQFEKEVFEARFIVRLKGRKLESVGPVLGPAHDGCLDADRLSVSGGLQDQIVPLADCKWHIADELAAAE
jgi:hypothetical protein